MSESCKESVDCRRREFPFGGPTAPGDFCWGEPFELPGANMRYLYVHIPGEDARHALLCFRGEDRGIEREWGWDGDEDRPTLTPSILSNGIWHGHLKAGRLESCP